MKCSEIHSLIKFIEMNSMVIHIYINRISIYTMGLFYLSECGSALAISAIPLSVKSFRVLDNWDLRIFLCVTFSPYILQPTQPLIFRQLLLAQSSHLSKQGIC